MYNTILIVFSVLITVIGLGVSFLSIRDTLKKIKNMKLYQLSVIEYPDATYTKIDECWYKDTPDSIKVPVEVLTKADVKYYRFYSGTHPYPVAISECPGLVTKRKNKKELPIYG